MLEIKNLSFQYNQKSLLQNIDFSVTPGDYVAIIGESGCGKSTLLSLIYGLLQPKSGSVFWNSHQVLGPDFNLVPGEPMMKYLAQDFDLMPYITVAENIGKFLSNFFPEEKKQRTQELLALIDMQPFANVDVKLLSGGQKQRVALAKALAKEPELLLLDEPFSHIDNFRKNKLRRNLFQYLKNKNITCLIATHDSTDILSYTDKTIVLKNGELVRYKNTSELYYNPSSDYIASLFGEVNSLSLSLFKPSPLNEKVLLYPFELLVKKEGTVLTGIVANCYLQSNHFLIAIQITKAFDGQAPKQKDCHLFFESKTALAIGSETTLGCSDESLLKTRKLLA